jgi:cysteine desulfurase
VSHTVLIDLQSTVSDTNFAEDFLPMRVYLDHAATTPLDSEVEAIMRPYQFTLGNAASVHRHGAEAREALEDARERLARALHTSSRELIFTSGGTEANNHAILGFGLHRGGHIITTAIEHSAVLAPARMLETMGRAEVTYLQPDAHSVIQAQQVRAALRPNTVLVSVMHVNNELGTVQDVPGIAEVCQPRGISFHVDAVQSLGSVPLDVRRLGCDLLSISAHKFYGPKGVGALWIRRGLDVPPFMLGGHQEGGLRGGTHNLPGAIGMSFAAEKAVTMQPAESARLEVLRDGFARRLLGFDGVHLNGPSLGSPNRSPRHVNITAHGADGEALLMNLDLEGVSASSGSACSAGTLEPSHVLLAIGHTKADARASVRFSLGRDTTQDTLEFAVQAFSRALERSRL